MEQSPSAAFLQFFAGMRTSFKPRTISCANAEYGSAGEEAEAGYELDRTAIGTAEPLRALVLKFADRASSINPINDGLSPEHAFATNTSIPIESLSPSCRGYFCTVS